MIFLIEYDRSKGLLTRFEHFADAQRSNAQKQRLQIELDLRSRKIEREVVLLEALSEDALRKTHLRYFKNAHQIGKVIRDNAA